jgi:hypothetical protein
MNLPTGEEVYHIDIRHDSVRAYLKIQLEYLKRQTGCSGILLAGLDPSTTTTTTTTGFPWTLSDSLETYKYLTTLAHNHDLGISIGVLNSAALIKSIQKQKENDESGNLNDGEDMLPDFVVVEGCYKRQDCKKYWTITETYDRPVFAIEYTTTTTTTTPPPSTSTSMADVVQKGGCVKKDDTIRESEAVTACAYLNAFGFDGVLIPASSSCATASSSSVSSLSSSSSSSNNNNNNNNGNAASSTSASSWRPCQEYNYSGTVKSGHWKNTGGLRGKALNFVSNIDTTNEDSSEDQDSRKIGYYTPDEVAEIQKKGGGICADSGSWVGWLWRFLFGGCST